MEVTFTREGMGGRTQDYHRWFLVGIFFYTRKRVSVLYASSPNLIISIKLIDLIC